MNTYDNATSGEIAHSLREDVLDAHSEVIKRTRTRAEDSGGDDVDHEVAEELGAGDRRLSLLGFEDLREQTLVHASKQR